MNNKIYKIYQYILIYNLLKNNYYKQVKNNSNNKQI